MQEHQVTVVLKLFRRQRPKEKYGIHELTDRLAAAVEKHGVGRHTGHQFAEDECSIHFSGPNADRLFNTIRAPLLGSLHSCGGGHVIKRYGVGPGNKEERVELTHQSPGSAAKRSTRRRTRSAL